MNKSGPHLLEKHLLEILNQYDDKNNRVRICTYRKAIKILKERLHKGDDPHMIRVIVKKILRSYKKRLEVALETLTSTPPSSDDEDAEIPNTNCFDLLPSNPQAVYDVLREVDESHSVETTINNNKIEKNDQTTHKKDKASYNNTKSTSSNVLQKQRSYLNNKCLLLGGTNKRKEKYIEGKIVLPNKRKRETINIDILNPIKNQPMAKNIFQKKNNLLLGGSRKKRTKRINYKKLADNEETENIDIVQINIADNNDEEREPTKRKRKKGYHTNSHKTEI